MGKNNKVEPTFLFNSSFERFVRYRRSFPSQYPDADNHPNLAAWVEKQRFLFKAGKLPLCRKEVLDDFGFDWGVPSYDNNCTDDQWYEQCKKWVQVQKEQQKLAAQPAGEEHAPKEEDSILSRWIQTQHEARARRELCPHRQAFLKSIGFFRNVKRPSNYSAEAWNIMYAELEKHHATHGHSKVSYSQYNKLSKWISDQRRKFHGSKGTLDPDREAKLRKLGVDLDTPLAGYRKKKRQKTPGKRASVEKATDDSGNHDNAKRETKRARREAAKEVAKSYYYGDESSKVGADEKEDNGDEDEATGGTGEEEAQDQKAASTSVNSHADDRSVGLFQDDLDSSDEEDEETDNQDIIAGEDETQNASKRARRASMTLKSYAEDLSDLSSNAVEKAGKEEKQDVSKRARRASTTVKSYAEDLSDLSSNAVEEAGKDETEGVSKQARRASMKVKSYAEDFSDLSSTGSV